jgi:hypothetical protein
MTYPTGAAKVGYSVSLNPTGAPYFECDVEFSHNIQVGAPDGGQAAYDAVQVGAEAIVTWMENEPTGTVGGPHRNHYFPSTDTWVSDTSWPTA